MIFADSRSLPWDPEGRILLPEDLLAHAGIGETAAFIGKGQTFQIWEPGTYTATAAEIRSRAQKAPPTLRLSPARPSSDGGGT